MAKRHSDALAIQGGACNPVAILNSIDEAVTAVRAEMPGWDAIREDCAIRLMVHQLAWLCGAEDFQNMAEYEKVLNACKAQVLL